MYGVSQLFQFRNYFFPHPQLPFERQSAAAYCRIGYGSHADSAAGYSRMVVEKRLGRGIVLTHSLECGGPDCPVAQFQRSYLDRSKKIAHD